MSVVGATRARRASAGVRISDKYMLDATRLRERNYAPMTINSALTHAEAERLAARIAELEHERKHLLAVIEILKEASSSLHFIDIPQSIARKLGESFGRDASRAALSVRNARPYVRVAARGPDPSGRRPQTQHELLGLRVVLLRLLSASGQRKRACDESLLAQAGAYPLDRLGGVALAAT